MPMVERSRTGRAFRMDDRKQRLAIDRTLPDGERCFGWEVADTARLRAPAVRFGQAGAGVRQERAPLADQPFARESIRFAMLGFFQVITTWH
jgi:hypothetical protein